MAGEAIPLMGGFDISSFSPIDIRLSVADSTARLALKYPPPGQGVYQIDTKVVYEFIGDTSTIDLTGGAPYTVVADWSARQKWFSGTGVPTTDGVSTGDLYLDVTPASSGGLGTMYKWNGSSWDALFGTSGASIYVGDPQDSLGAIDGDLIISNATGTFPAEESYIPGDVFSFGSTGDNDDRGLILMNITGAIGDKYATTSSTALDTTAQPSSTTWVVDTGLAYTAGQDIVAAGGSAIVTGEVTSYNSSTGDLVVGSLGYNGTFGSISSWEVNLDVAGDDGPAGKGFVLNASSLTLTQAIVTSVAGNAIYTAINPYLAFVATDSRTTAQKSSTSGLVGDLKGFIIIWDGTSWKSARWQGSGAQSVSPQYVIEVNGERRVLKITGFSIGDLAYQNDIGKYLGNSQLESSISNGTDIRGPKGNTGNVLVTSEGGTLFSSRFAEGTKVFSTSLVPGTNGNPPITTQPGQFISHNQIFYKLGSYVGSNNGSITNAYFFDIMLPLRRTGAAGEIINIQIQASEFSTFAGIPELIYKSKVQIDHENTHYLPISCSGNIPGLSSTIRYFRIWCYNSNTGGDAIAIFARYLPFRVFSMKASSIFIG